MSITPRTSTGVRYVVQGSQCRNGGVWDDWSDMPDDERSKDVYDAIGKAELFHYFMEHGAYPDAHIQKVAHSPFFQQMYAQMQAAHAILVEERKRDGFKFRTRIVKRTVVKTVTDDVIDVEMVVKHGAEG